MYNTLIQNAFLLVALASLYNLVTRIRSRYPTRGRILIGLLFGAMTVLGMKLPFYFNEGIIYDGRSIILTLAGLYGGGTVVIISGVIAGIYRAILGGAGVWAGLATIIACSATGLFFRRRVKNHPENYNLLELYEIGFVTHIVMLICQLLVLPLSSGLTVIGQIWVPIMLIFPVTTMIIGALLSNEEKRLILLKDLESNHNFLLKTQAIGNIGNWEYDLINNRLTWSEQVYRIWGVDPRKYKVSYDNFLSSVHPDDRTAVDSTYRNSVSKGLSSYEIEHRIVRPESGEIRVVYEKCEHIRDKDNRVIKSVGIVQDVTDRKQAEEELEKHRSHLEELVKERTAELEEKNKELERYNKLFEGREFRIKELKDKVKELEKITNKLK